MDKNKVINGNVYGVVNAEDGANIHQNIILPEHKTPTQLTSKLGKDTIIGRVKELEEIDILLKESSSLLLINGIGGIGKSTIASYYLHSQKENLDYYGFFEGLDSFVTELRPRLNLKEEKSEDAFMEALSELSKLKGEKLLVFDDVKEIEENQDKIEKILALKDSGYKILLTSREEIEDVEQYYLDVLSLTDAKELFNSIYPVEDEVLLEEILGYLDCHAFFVEMTAKTLKSKKTLTPEIIKEKFENGEFSTIKRKRKESFNELFSFDELDEEEILMLKQLSVLPSIEIEFEFLQEIFSKEDDEEFEEVLNYLCERGWLSSFENGYKLHQIVKEFILLSENSPCFEEIEKIVDFFTNIMQNIHTLEDTLSKKRYLGFLESILFVLKDRKSENIAYFLHATGYLSFVLGNYKKAEELYKQSSAIREKILDENDIQLSISINNEASIYEHNGDYKKALKLYLKSLKIRVQYFGIYPDKVAIVYNNIGRMYEKIDDYDKARDYLHESLNMRKEIFGEKHESTARAYNVLGSFFQDVTKRTEDKKEAQKNHISF
jgi:tetratricopeptide (TPR) repeat protein